MTATSSSVFNIHFLFLSFLIGFLPVLIWLFFWLSEDRKKPEPRSLIFSTFVLGMLSVFLAYFIESFLESPSLDLVGWTGWLPTLPYFSMAVVEEVVKFSLIAFIIGRNRHLDEPIDAMVYMITVALGFASMENMLFLLNSLGDGDTASIFLFTGGLRFLGSTILHTVCSAIVGAGWALSFYQSSKRKIFVTLGALIVAIALHTAFNFLIIISVGQMMLPILIVLWFFVFFILFLFELAKRVKIKN
ncbi:MAG: PrsW family intramembrane metalloprotease [Candidatus Paceibacterota bacterium]|jgi:RsiW-degrading membrane proteinase PrsW (M82 family)